MRALAGDSTAGRTPAPVLAKAKRAGRPRPSPYPAGRPTEWMRNGHRRRACSMLRLASCRSGRRSEMSVSRAVRAVKVEQLIAATMRP